MNFSTVEFLHAGQFVLKPVIFDCEVLILMKEVVDFELKFREGDIFSTELIFEFDEFVLEFDSELALVVEVVFELILVFLELLAFIFQHELKFSGVMVFEGIWMG